MKLDLSNNLLSGFIPEEIWSCTHLTYLDLSLNSLTGLVPTEISSVKIMSYLNLSHNHLNGTLPMSLGSLKSLTNADFSFKDFSGKLPESGQFLVFNASAFVGNPLLCGLVLNNSCNSTLLESPTRKSNGEFKLIFALVFLFCSNKHTNLLIYEYMRNGSLGKALHGKKLRSLLGWNLSYSHLLRLIPTNVDDICVLVGPDRAIGNGGEHYEEGVNMMGEEAGEARSSSLDTTSCSSRKKQKSDRLADAVSSFANSFQGYVETRKKDSSLLSGKEVRDVVTKVYGILPHQVLRAVLLLMESPQKFQMIKDLPEDEKLD